MSAALARPFSRCVVPGIPASWSGWEEPSHQGALGTGLQHSWDPATRLAEPGLDTLGLDRASTALAREPPPASSSPLQQPSFHCEALSTDAQGQEESPEENQSVGQPIVKEQLEEESPDLGEETLPFRAVLKPELASTPLASASQPENFEGECTEALPSTQQEEFGCHQADPEPEREQEEEFAMTQFHGCSPQQQPKSEADSPDQPEEPPPQLTQAVEDADAAALQCSATSDMLPKPEDLEKSPSASGSPSLRPDRRLRIKTQPSVITWRPKLEPERLQAVAEAQAVPVPEDLSQAAEALPSARQQLPGTPTPKRSQDGSAQSNAKRTGRSKAQRRMPQAEDVQRRSLGHMLQPPQQGRRVAVIGDGWGGGTSGYEALVIEADALSYTVVVLSGEDRWTETHVLKEFCIEVSEEALTVTMEESLRKRRRKAAT